MNKEKKIKQLVEDIKDGGFADEHLYFPCIEALKKENLKNIKEETVYGPITVFLLNWGRMGRVLERKGKEGWEKDLLKAIPDVSDKLKKFSKMDLEKADLKTWENEIKECYRVIRDIVAPTSASKTLHLIAPSFFPMWDEKIRENKNVTASMKGYFDFMCKNQNFIREHPVISELSEKYRKSKLKITDEYFWKTRK